MQNQENLKRNISRFTTSTFPHSVLLLGDAGSGHYEICEFISEHLGIDLYDITEMLDGDFINSLSSYATLSLCVVNLEKITEKEQNMLLKFYEEPSPYIYLIIYGETSDNALETIVNRSYIIKMDKYRRDDLEKLVISDDKELILDVCNTPGLIELANHTDMKALNELCKSIVEKMKNANYSNALSISDKINFTDQYDKYDLKLFIRMLSKCILEIDQSLYEPLQLFTKTYSPLLDKKRWFENMITSMWFISRGIAWK